MSVRCEISGNPVTLPDPLQFEQVQDIFLIEISLSLAAWVAFVWYQKPMTVTDH